MKFRNLQNIIGMRAIKTALSVSISIYLSMLLKLDYSIFPAISALTSIQPTFAQSYIDMKNRAFTAVIGILLGVLFAYLFPNPWLKPIAAAIGILIIIKLLLLIHAEKSITLSCIVFVAALVTTADNVVVYGLDRILGTLLGIGVGFLVNLLISSPNTYENFLKLAREGHSATKEIFFMEVINNKSGNVEGIDQYAAQLKEVYNHLTFEGSTFLGSKLSLDNSSKIKDLLYEVQLLTIILKDTKENRHTNLANRELIAKNFKYTLIDAPKDVSDEDDIVFNYNYKLALNSLVEIDDLIKIEERKLHEIVKH